MVPSLPRRLRHRHPGLSRQVRLERAGSFLPRPRTGRLDAVRGIERQRLAYGHRQILVQYAGPSVFDDIDRSGDGECRGRHPARHRFQHDQPQRVGSTRKDEHVRRTGRSAARRLSGPSGPAGRAPCRPRPQRARLEKPRPASLSRRPGVGARVRTAETWNRRRHAYVRSTGTGARAWIHSGNRVWKNAANGNR